MNETKQLLVYFADEYKNRYQQGYALSWARHGAQAKRLLEGNSLTTLKSAVKVYLNDFADSYYEKRGKPFDLLSVALPELLRKVRDEEAARKRPRGGDDYRRVLEAREASRRARQEIVPGVQGAEARRSTNGDTDS